jgi:hypothetical protein
LLKICTLHKNYSNSKEKIPHYFNLLYKVETANSPIVIDASFFAPEAAAGYDWLVQEEANTNFVVKIKEQFRKIEGLAAEFKNLETKYCDERRFLQNDNTFLQITARTLGVKKKPGSYMELLAQLESSYPPYYELQTGLMVVIQYEIRWTKKETNYKAYRNLEIPGDVPPTQTVKPPVQTPQPTATPSTDEGLKNYDKLVRLEKGHSFPAWFEPLKKSEETEFFTKVSCALGLKKRPHSWPELRNQFSKDPLHAISQVKLCDLIARYIHITQEVLVIKRKKPELFKIGIPHSTIFLAQGKQIEVDYETFKKLGAINSDWAEQEKAKTSLAVRMSKQKSIEQDMSVRPLFKKIEKLFDLEMPELMYYSDVDRTFLQRAACVLGLKNVPNNYVELLDSLEGYLPYGRSQRKLADLIFEEIRWESEF